MRKGQGSFEYVLLLAGVLLIVVLAIVLLQGTFGGGSTNANLNKCRAGLASDATCYYSNGTWKSCGVVSATTYFASGCGGNNTPVNCTIYADATTTKYCGNNTDGNWS